MIALEGVSKTYGEGQPAVLRDVSLQIMAGEFVVLQGESGCGKTTLLKLLLRELCPQQGRIRVNGSYLDTMRSGQIARYRRSIGVVFQDFRLIEDRTVYENVMLPRIVAGSCGAQAGRRVSAVLNLLGIAGLYRQYPRELSGGEKQKVCLARAIVNQPGLLLADEPTGNLDPNSAAEVFAFMEEINHRGITVLLVTHELTQRPRYGHRILRLQDGVLM